MRDRAIQFLGAVVGARAPEIERRWLARSEENTAELALLRDVVPAYLFTLGRSLREPEPARAHGEAIALLTTRLAHEPSARLEVIVQHLRTLQRTIRDVASDEDGVHDGADELLEELFQAAIAKVTALDASGGPR